MELLGSFTIVNEYSCAHIILCTKMKYRYLAKKENFQANNASSSEYCHCSIAIGWGGEVDSL